jgi:putative flippase GtrA
MTSLHPVDKLGQVTDELTSTLELPAGARVVGRARLAYRRGMYELRHPENHKQAVRFLCVGASGYAINFVADWILLHAVGLDYKLAFCGAFICASINNFFWNRHWTFKADYDHPGRQAVRFFGVQLVIAVFAYLIMIGLVAATNIWKVPADAIAWILVTPVSFLLQKLWSFKA